MDYRPNYYSNRNAVDKSNRYKKKRIFWLNSSFNSDFVLINNKIYEISWDIPPFEIYKNNRLKLLTYIRDSNQSKPIQIKLKLPLTQSRNIINTDKEAFPIIYTNHSSVEAMTYGSNPIIRLIPQQITRFTFRLDDNFNQLDYNYYFNSITNGSVFQVANGNPDDKYIIFNSSGSFVLDKNLNCDILIVGGGGGGGARHGGGGGAGAVIYFVNQNLNSGTYTITVGAGGLKSANTNSGQYGQNGGDSSIVLSGTTIYLAKGGGGACVGLSAGGDGLAGGSGAGGTGSGGGGDGIGGNVSIGGTAVNTNIPSEVYGNSGGKGYGGAGLGTQWSGGGGGGAGNNGGDVIIDGSGYATGGAGGVGRQINITGTNTYYGGGGGGGVSEVATAAGTGGLGGGGNGGKGYGTGSNGTANTGGGGGGGGWGFNSGDSSSLGGDGGSGLVIIRFKEIRNEGITAEENLIQATNNSITVNTDSKYVINYQNPVNIPKGTYQSIFANGAITFKSKPNYNYPTTSKNPIVWYKFDGSQLLYDSSGNNNLINNNEVNIDTSIYTRGNGSALFNPSTSSYFTMPKLNYNTINTTNGISFSFWGRFKSTTGTYAAVFQFIGSGGHCLLYRDGGNNFAFYNEIVSPADVKFITTSGINNFDNTWRHYTWTISTTGIWNIYINGGATNNNFSGNVISSGLNANQSYVSSIGRRTDTNHNIDGNIDDFRVFDYVLSPVEVYDLYNGNTDRSYPILKDANNATINPFVWYQFDTSGNLGSDSMGIHNLTNPNGVAFSNDYIKGNGSASFDGVNDHLIKDSAFNLNSKSWSISVWFKKTANSRNDWLFELGTGLSAGTTLTCGYRNTNVIGISNYNNDLNTAATYNDAGNWVHLCFTFLTGTKQATIYRNGVQVAQSNFTIELNTNNNFRIGKLDTLYCQGLMDDFRIYESVLTATQVSELYNGRISIYNPPAFLTGFELEDEDLIRDNTISSYK